MGAVVVRELIDQEKDRLDLQLLSGKSGLSKRIFRSQVEIFSTDDQFWSKIEKGTVLIVGRGSLSDFSAITVEPSNPIFNKILKLDIPLIIFSEVNFLPAYLTRFSEAYSIPFLASSFDQFLLRSRILGILREKIDGLTTLQGVFVQVFGVGILIKGESGLGKSECALELVNRGHKIISDDLIEIHKSKIDSISGQSPDISQNLLYIKGIGIIDIKELYGEGAVLDHCRVDIIVEFVEWSRDINIMGQDEFFVNIMDVNVPMVKIPIRPNQMTTIVEVVAKRFLLEGGSTSGVRIPGLT